MKKCYVYKQHCQCYVYKKEYSLSSPIFELPHLFCIHKKLHKCNKVAYIPNCYNKEKNVMFITKVVNVQCYVYEK